MRKKSFSVFFWIFVVLVAILLFFVMGTTVEGFFTTCHPNSNVNTCPTCYQTDGKTVKATCNNYQCGCPSNSSTTKPKTPSTGGPVAPKTCPIGYKFTVDRSGCVSIR